MGDLGARIVKKNAGRDPRAAENSQGSARAAAIRAGVGRAAEAVPRGGLLLVAHCFRPPTRYARGRGACGLPEPATPRHEQNQGANVR